MLRSLILLCSCLTFIACELEQDIETNTPDQNDQKSSLVVECQPDACGPEISITCAEGTELISAPVCEASEEGACEWSGGECSDLAPIGEPTVDEPNNECQPDDCGPSVAISCEMGTQLTHESICEANIAGVCEWNIGECVEDEPSDDDVESACQPEDCGPELAISCEMGSQLTHESICEANADGECEWTVGDCVGFE